MKLLLLRCWRLGRQPALHAHRFEGQAQVEQLEGRAAGCAPVVCAEVRHRQRWQAQLVHELDDGLVHAPEEHLRAALAVFCLRLRALCARCCLRVHPVAPAQA